MATQREIRVGAPGRSPVDKVLEKRLPPSDWPVAAAVVIVEPSPSEKPAAGCCAAVPVRTEPNDKPAPAGAAEEVGAVVREKGAAEPVGLVKGRLKPVDAAVAAGAPERKYMKKRKKISYNTFSFSSLKKKKKKTPQ